MSRRGRGRGRCATRGRGGYTRDDRTKHFDKVLFTHSEGSGSDLMSLDELNFASYEAQQDVTKLTSPVKRLFKDYLEVRISPLPFVSIAPLPNDFFEWRGNIFGPEGTQYEGGIFHFCIDFPANYPRSPPGVRMLTRIHHPCVSGQTVTLPFSAAYEGYGLIPDRYEVWTPEYTAQSILMQLQSLLFQGTVETAMEQVAFDKYDAEKQKWLTAVKGSVEQSLRYEDSISKHRPRHPVPPRNDPTKVEIYLNDKTTSRQIGAEWAVCFFTKKTYEEAVLGLGVNISKNVRTGKIQTVYCSPDITSLNAFNGLKIKQAFGENFSYLVPIYLIDSHYAKCKHLIRTALARLYTGAPTLDAYNGDMAVDFFPKCLIKLTLQFLERKGAKAMRSLSAFGYMHRVFLQLAVEDPKLQQDCKLAVKRFVEDPKNRDKDAIASVAELLVLMLMSGDAWTEELCVAYVDETMARNVYWITKRFPKLDKSDPNPEIDKFRAEKSYEVTTASNRLLMMLLTLSNLFAGGRTLEDISKQYDDHLGRIPPAIIDQILSEKEKVLEVNTYKKFFEMVRYPVTTDDEINTKLRTAVEYSVTKKYHRDRGIEVVSPEEFEKQRLGSIKPLNEMVVQKAGDGEFELLDEEDEWKKLTDIRFGFSELPQDYTQLTKPWRQLYLQYSLQELVSKLNENPDFNSLYTTTEICSKYIQRFEITTFRPDNIKSQFYFIARILQKLTQLSYLTIVKGEVGLGQRGFKELIKGLEKASGSLQVLDMRYSDITEASVAALAESHLTSDRLYKLDLEGNNLGMKGTEMLAGLLTKHQSLPNLTHLNLRACKINDAGVKELAEGLLVKKKLLILNLSKNQFQAPGIAAIIKNLAYSDVIEHVNLSEIAFSPSSSIPDTHELVMAFVKLFKLNISLKTMNFWKTHIGVFLKDGPMKQFYNSTTIELMDLGHTGFTSYKTLGHGLLSQDCSLRELNLESNNIATHTFEATLNLFDKEKKYKFPSGVQVLNLTSNSFPNLESEKPRKLFVRVFCEIFCNLKELKLSKCSFSDSSTPAIAEYLASDPTLETLDLSFNSLGRHGARILCEGLRANTHLKNLRLDHNDFKAAGAKFIAELIKSPNCSLIDLSLFCNYFDVPGIVEIATALKVNRSLEVLDLGMNKIRKRGAGLMCEALQENATLKTLKLKFNLIPDEFCIKLVKSVLESKNSKLAELFLAGNNLEYETLVTIVGLVRDSPKHLEFDLSRRAEYLDPERIERTIYLTPLAANITLEMVKRLLYTSKCGAIISVKVEKHKKRGSFASAKYALVEFAHKASVDLALDLVNKGEARIGSGLPIHIVRAGVGKGATLDPAMAS